MSIAKLVFVNQSAGQAKYKTTGWTKVEKALKGLVKADKERGISTKLVRIDNKDEMEKYGVSPVTNPKNASAVKRVVDAVFKSVKPHYVLLLGGPDLIPHVPLKNPLFGHNDEDEFIPSDLPYACDAAYGLDPSKFLGITRVVGRLPDVAGDSSPDYLIKLIKFASGWVSRNKSSYEHYFGVTAKVWKGSTRKNVTSLFGSTKPLQISPSDAPKWSKSLLKPRVHFVNCHGAQSDSKFYGDDGRDIPVAHFSENLEGMVTEGTVVAAECCYGAELYKPSIFGEQFPLPICNRYLAESAYAYLGSTTISYGSDSKLVLADQICHYFLKNVMHGASTGRALLEARQNFLRRNAPINPYALKTLAQFVLLGDPSIHPVKKSKTKLQYSKSLAAGLETVVSSKSKPKKKSPVRIKRSLWGKLVDNVGSSRDLSQLFQKTVDTTTAHIVDELEQRGDRRTNLFQKGVELGRKVASVGMATMTKSSLKKVSGLLKNYANNNLQTTVSQVTAFIVDEAQDFIHAKSAVDKRRGSGTVRFLVGVVETVKEPIVDKVSGLVEGIASKSMRPSSPKVIRKVMLVATERNGKIESNQKYFSR